MVPNHEKKEIITCIRVCHDLRNNIDSKKIGVKRSISYENKTSMSFIPMRRMCLWCPTMKKGDYYLHPCLS